MRDATHRRDEGTLREAYDSQKAHLDHLFASLREAVVLVDNQGTVKEVNPEFERLFGYPREEVLGRNIDDLIAPDDLEEEARDVTESVVEGRRQLLETRRRRRDGSVVDVSVLASPISVGGNIVGFYGIYRDITERKRATERLARSRERISRLHEITGRLEACNTEEDAYSISVDCGCRILSFDQSAIYIVRKDRLAPSYFSDPCLKGQLGETPPGHGLVGQVFMEQRTILPAPELVADSLACRADGHGLYPVVLSPIGSFGVFVGYSTNDVLTDDEQVSLLKMHLGYLSEAIKRIRLHEELKEQALHDPLTGLFNRNYFNRFIKMEVERSSRYRHGIGIVVLDVNDFKDVNDNLGHQTGDEVLRMIAGRLAASVRASDIVIRYGGDEFLVILPESNGEMEPLVDRIREEVCGIPEITALTGSPLSLAMGTALWRPGEDRSIDSVIAEADREMYEDKKMHHSSP